MIAIVKYDAGNVLSLINALRRCGAPEFELTADPDRLRMADKVLLPGVGDASVALRSLRDLGLDEVVRSLKCPVLGICVGMQVLCRHCEEGNVDGLGIFDAQVTRFIPGDPQVKIPHIGWNKLEGMRTDLFKGIPEGSFMYFVHSYRAEVCRDTVATTVHGAPFSAAMAKDNFYGTQFHPEKSGPAGSALIKNFLAL
jgi:glutamine amidotransferase